MKQLEVSIMGQSYLLGCPEGGEPQLLDAVARVDTAMCKIRDAGKVKARDRIAVLAALNLAFEVADTPAAAPAASAPSSAAAPGVSADISSDDQVRIAALIRRLDAVLGDDGRLL